MGLDDERNHLNHHHVKFSASSIRHIIAAIFQYCFESDKDLTNDCKIIAQVIMAHHDAQKSLVIEGDMLVNHFIALHDIPTFLDICYQVITLCYTDVNFQATHTLSIHSLILLFQNTDNIDLTNILENIKKLKQESTSITMEITSQTHEPAEDLVTTDEYPNFNLKEGDQVGAQSWTLKSQIGVGGMGRIWKVKNYFGDIGALKVMNPKIISSHKFISRFQSEIQSLKKLEHPNIVNLLDWGCDKTYGMDLWYFVTEFIEGQSLSQYLHTQSQLNDEQIYQIFLDLSYGLRAAHTQSIIHRDIKPSNVMLKDDGEPILIDFGIARQTQEPTTTQSNEQLLTLKFASPEQIYGDKVTPASDIFSLAATINECLIKTNTQARPKFQPKLTPQIYHEVLRTSLNYEVDERPQSMDEFISLWKGTRPQQYTADQVSRTIINTAHQVTELSTTPIHSTDTQTQIHTLDEDVEYWFRKAKSTLYTQSIAIMSFMISIITLALYLQMTPLFTHDEFQISSVTQVPRLLLFYAASCFCLTLALYKVKTWSLLLIVTCSLAILPLYHEFYLQMHLKLESPLATSFIYILIVYTILSCIAFWPFLSIQRARRKLRYHGFNIVY